MSDTNKSLFKIGQENEFDQPDYIDEIVALLPNDKANFRGHCQVISLKGSFEMTDALFDEHVEIKNAIIQNVYISIHAGNHGCSLILRRGVPQKKF